MVKLFVLRQLTKKGEGGKCHIEHVHTVHRLLYSIQIDRSHLSTILQSPFTIQDCIILINVL